MKIETGYTHGIIGDVVAMHARYYGSAHGFGSAFESVVASGMADFVPRLEKPINQIWHVKENDQISASIAIDGEDLGDNCAHLRWFIVDDSLRGTGVGNKLMDCTVSFCQETGFDKCVLWTFKGLDAARRLYEKKGFTLEEEYEGDQWGTKVVEQKFVREF